MVPSVVHRSYKPSKNEEKWRERAELVDPHSFLELHPLDDFGGVVTGAPSLEIYDHNASVEVTGISSGEGERQRGVGPESGCEIRGQISVAILRRGEDGSFPKWGSGKFSNVVDKDQIGVQINNAFNAVGD